MFGKELLAELLAETIVNVENIEKILKSENIEKILKNEKLCKVQQRQQEVLRTLRGSATRFYLEGHHSFQEGSGDEHTIT